LSDKVEVRHVTDPGSDDARRFMRLPFRLYHGNPCWVPWFRADMLSLLRRRHPFFEHSDGTFLVATRGAGQGAGRRAARPSARGAGGNRSARGDETAGRLAVLENRRYNEQHGMRSAHFYFFDAVDDPSVTEALFAEAARWAAHRGLDVLLGPMGFGGATGSGILIDGFEHRAAMTMMPYNHPYYGDHLEAVGFTKFLDIYSASIRPDRFRLPDRVRSVAEKVLERGHFRVMRFRRRSELGRVAGRLGAVYNTAEAGHLETYGYSEREIEAIIRDLMLVADPSLIKVLAYKDEVVGFLFAFPDLSEAMQRAGGRLNPLVVCRLLRERRRARSLVVNGAGILPRYQRLGGNALLYHELEKTVRGRGVRHVDLAQIAETTTLMLRDIETLGGRLYKTHRIYRLDL